MRTPSVYDRIATFQPVRICVSILLLATALSTSSTSTIDVPSGTMSSSTAFIRIVTTQAQLLLAIWLMSGLYKQQAWVTAVAILFVLTGFELVRLPVLSATTAASCRWWPPIVHAICITALLAVRSAMPQARQIHQSRSRLTLSCTALLAIGAAAGLPTHAPVLAVLRGQESSEARLRNPRQLGGSRLVAASDIVDFGPISRNESGTLRREISLTNVGSSTVVIQKVLAGCTCTHAAVDRQSVLPAQSAVLRIDVDWSNRVGMQEERVIVLTDQAVEPPLTVVVRGFVTAPALLEPAVLHFGGPHGNNWTSYVTISQGPNTSPTLHVLDVSCPRKGVSVSRVDMQGRELPFRDGPGRFAVTVDPSTVAGGERITVTFRTDIEAQPAMSLLLTIHGTHRLAAQPSALLFLLDRRNDQLYWQDVTVTAEAGLMGQFQARLDNDLSKAFMLEPVHSTDPQVWRCRIGVNPQQCDTRSRGTLSVSIGSNTIAIPILSLFRGAK